MYMVVYVFRYGDIIWNRHSLYLTLMKVVYLCVTAYIIYLVRFKKPYCLVGLDDGRATTSTRIGSTTTCTSIQLFWC